jgi:hypothetical protein
MRIVSFIILAALGGAALAQPTGTRMGRTADDQRDVGVVLEKIGRCMARTQPEITRKWLDLVPGSDAEAKFVMLQEPRLEVCMEHGDSRIVTTGQLEYVPVDIRRYAALEAAFRAAAAAPATLPAGASEKPWVADALTKMTKGAEIDTRSIVQQDFGHCVVIANWAAARDFLRSKPRSKEETAAIEALKPALGPCIDNGAKVELTKPGIRYALSEPFYHLAVASSPAAQAREGGD